MPGRIVEGLRNWMESRRALWGVFFASLAEATAVPIPIEIALIPVMLTNRARLWLVAAVALLGCLVGSGTAYWIGYGAYRGGGGVARGGARSDRATRGVPGEAEWRRLRVRHPDRDHPGPLPDRVLRSGGRAHGLLEVRGRGDVRPWRALLRVALLVAIAGRAAGPWLERNKFGIAVLATRLFIGGYTAYELIR